jgi:septal ring-binding cell division protein DamX
MNLGGNQSLKFIDLAQPWVKLSVPGPLTGWVPVLGLIEQSEDNASLQRIWQDEYQSKSRNSHKDTDIAVLSESLRAQDNVDTVSAMANATALKEVSSIAQSTGQPLIEPAASESASSAPLERNDYDWLLAQASKRYTLELFSSTSEMLIREFYRAELFDDHVSYFSSSVSGKRWFTLFHGSYSDLDSVQKALSLLPVRLDAMRVRRISSVVHELCSSLDDVPVAVLENLKTRCSEQM